MFRKVLIGVLAGSLLIAGFGCSKKEVSNNTSVPGGQGTGAPIDSAPAKPINGDEVAANITKALDAKYPGDWSTSGTTLKKGSYTENDNYEMVAEVEKLYPGAMVSIFVGEDRVSSNIKENGKPVLKGYPTPPEVGQTMTSGKILVTNAGSMGSSTYQKVYLPLKAADKTVAVMTISIAQ